MADLSHLSPETRDELASLALQLAASGKTRKTFLKQVREVAPGTPIPELDQEAEFDRRLNEATAPLQKTLQELQQERQRDGFAKQRAEMADKHGLSQEDMGKVDKMITEGSLPADYKFAAPLYKAQAEPAAPTNFGAGAWGPAVLPSQDGLMQDEARWSLTEAHTAVDELRKRAAGSNF